MPARSSWKYPHQGLLIILGLFVVATLASILFLTHTLQTLSTLITDSGQTARTIVVAQDMLINLDDAETGARGYVITGDTSYLAPYESAVRNMPQTYKILRTLPANQISKTKVNKLQQLADRRLDLLKQLIAIRASGDEDQSRLAVSSGVGKATMDELRKNIGDISAAGLNTVGPREQQSHTNLRQAQIVAATQVVFILGICVALVWYFQRSLYRERALESTKSEFLSLASHQLRTPATNVKQYVGLLLDGYLGDLSSKQRDALGVAYKNNELEIKIVNDLLDVAKLDLKRIQLSKQMVNIASLVQQVAEDYEPVAEAKQQTMTLKIPERLMAMVDRTYFKGVVEKLVDNAIKYSRPQTRITVRVRLFDSGRQFAVIVRDQGVGMQKRDIAKLFMKFSRLSNEFSANSEGSGTGLYWVKQIVELHGGSVRVVTHEGSGSKFIVRMPMS